MKAVKEVTPVDPVELRSTFARVLNGSKALLDLAHDAPESKEGRQAFFELYRAAEALTSAARVLIP